MTRKIKLIWDFKGPNGAQTAVHHEKHLKEYIAMEKLPLHITGYQNLNDLHSLAFMVIVEEDMMVFRDALKPHRAEVWTAPPKD